MRKTDEPVCFEEERRRVYARHDEIVREHRLLAGIPGDHEAVREHQRKVEQHLAELRRIAERLVPD